MAKEPELVRRYWLYADRRVSGPMSVEELIGLDGFSGDSLLCGENDLGGKTEEWRRAASTHAFRAIFPPSLQGKRISGHREAEMIGSVEGQIQSIDQSLSTAQLRLRLRQETFQRMHRELADRMRTAKELCVKIRKMSAQVKNLSTTRPEMEEAQAAIAMQQRRIAELEEKLRQRREDKQHRKITELEHKLAAVEREARRRPLSAPANSSTPAEEEYPPSTGKKRRKKKRLSKRPRKMQDQDPFGSNQSDPPAGDLGLPNADFPDDTPGF